MDPKLVVITIGFCISIFAMLSLAVFVLLKGGKKLVHIVFFLQNIFLAMWAISFVLITNISNPAISYPLMSIATTNALIVATFSHWIFLITGKAKKLKNFIITMYTVAFTIVTLSLIFPQHFIGSVEPKMYFKNYANDPGILYILMVLYLAVLSIFTLYILIKAHQNEQDADKKNRLKYVVFGSLLSWFLGPTAYFLVWDVQFDPILAMFVGSYNLIFGYAIFKHNLMDIRTAIKKTFFYSSTLALLSGLLMVVTLMNNWFIQNIPGFQLWTIPLVSAIVAVIIGNSFWRKSKESDMFKGEFVSIVSHKIRTPLTHIRWETAGVLEGGNGELNKEEHEVFTNIKEAGDTLVKISDMLFEISSHKAKSISCNLKKVSFENIVRKDIKDFYGLIKERRLSFSFHIEDDLPNVYADKDKISSIICGIIKNSITYTPRCGAIEITLRRKGKRFIEFRIRDNGMGLTRREAKQVFTKFFRSPDALQTDSKGLGLSLFLAKDIVEHHGGKIKVSSKGIGKGSTFCFTLRIVE